MKIRSILPMVAMAIVGALLAVWFQRSGESPPVDVPPANVAVYVPTNAPENAPEQEPPPSREDEAARLERERLERERAMAQCRVALVRTADSFLGEAAAIAIQAKDLTARTDRLREIALAQMRVGDLAAARTVALAMERGYYRSQMLRSILQDQIEGADFVEGRATFRAWYDGMVARVKGLEGKVDWWSTVAGVQTNLGDRDGATASLERGVALARKIGSTNKRNAELLDLARLQARIGDVAGVKATLGARASFWRNTDAPTVIASAQIKAGDFAGARATVAAMDLKKGRAESVWKEISQAQAEAGDFAGAVASGKASGSWEGTDLALGAIARVQSKAGDFLAAKATVAKMDQPAKQLWAMVAIAKAQISARDFAGARLTAGAIEFSEPRAETYLALAIAQGSAAAFADAREAATVVERPGQRAWACVTVAEAQIAAGELAGLGQFLEVIKPAAVATDPSYFYFGRIWHGFVWASVEAGDVPAAKKSLRETVAFVPIVQYVNCRSRKPSADDLLRLVERRDCLRVACGAGQVEIGDLVGALATLEVIEGAAARAMLLLKIAEGKHAAGDAAGAAKAITDALAATASAGDLSKKAQHEMGMARTYRSWGQSARATKLLVVEAVPFTRDILYLEIAGLQARLGSATDAKDTASKIGSSAKAAAAYQRVAVEQVRADNTAAALVTAGQIKGSGFQADARAAVAAALIETDGFMAARALAQKPYGLSFRTQACQRIARMYGERGNAADILEWARQEQAVECRISILLGGAEGLRIMAKSAEPSFMSPIATPPFPVPAPPAPDRQ